MLAKHPRVDPQRIALMVLPVDSAQDKPEAANIPKRFSAMATKRRLGNVRFCAACGANCGHRSAIAELSSIYDYTP